MGTVILADVTELETVKISELPEMASVGEFSVIPGVQGEITHKVTKANFLRFLKTEYDELSNWLAGGVTLGADGVTEVPEIVLVPAGSAPSDIEGGMYYNSIDKSIYVCIEI